MKKFMESNEFHIKTIANKVIGLILWIIFALSIFLLTRIWFLVLSWRYTWSTWYGYGFAFIAYQIFIITYVTSLVLYVLSCRNIIDRVHKNIKFLVKISTFTFWITILIFVVVPILGFLSLLFLLIVVPINIFISFLTIFLSYRFLMIKFLEVNNTQGSNKQWIKK